MNAPAATTQEKPAATSQAQEISTKAAAPAPSVPRLVANATEKQETKAAKPTKEAPRSASLQDETQQVLAAVSTSCETVFCAGAEAIAQVTSNYTDQLNTAQERISAMSNEALEHVSRSTDSALKQFNDAISSSQQSAEAITNIFQNSGNNFNKMSEELFNFANQCFARNIELSRDILSCRTINDAIELQNKMMQTNVDDVMEEMAKLTEMFFEAAAAAVDPLGETITNAVDRLSKTIAA